MFQHIGLYIEIYNYIMFYLITVVQNLSGGGGGGLAMV